MIARKPPGWFYIVGAVLLLWGLMGCFACVQQFRLGADAMGPASAYDRALHASLPIWYNALFAVSVGTPTLGAAMLLARYWRGRSRSSRWSASSSCSAGCSR